jgi:hypothetical protein
MAHKLGVYWSPAHDPLPELTYIHALQPPVIRILTEDVEHIVQAHAAAPEAIIIPRVWRLDDNRTEHNPEGVYEEINVDPYNAGVIHASKILGKVDTWRREAKERDLPFPHQDQICVGGANEPNGSCSYPVIAEYAKGFARQCMMLNHRRVALLILGHGHPATPPPNLIDWSAFMDLQPILDANPDFWIETHAYWFPEGPDHNDDYAWHAGRHHSCPLRAPHLIGECGVDGTIDERNPRWGWINYGLTSYRYAQQLKTNHDRLADNVVAQLPFALGSQSRDWNGYDITKATNEILQLDWKTEVKPVETNRGTVTANVLNVRGGPGTEYEVVGRLAHGDMVIIAGRQKDRDGVVWYRISISSQWVHSGWIKLEETGVGPGPKPVNKFDKTMRFIYRWEGGLSMRREDDGNWTGGEVGVGELKGTKFGISAASYPELDIARLTKKDAEAIYRHDYWEAAQANTHSYPMCLAVMDSAVLHGVGAVQSWGCQSVDEILGRRYRIYAVSKKTWAVQGWRNRLEDLARECHNAYS